ncbi:DoxX family protein [bacterium]|nr:MAG: DoxX family protein [bacterium]
MKKIFATRDDSMLTLLRIVSGFIILAHGVQKLFGWFGGHGIGETMDSFEQWFGLPAFVTFLVILSDSVGALCLIAGFATRFMASSIAAVMIGAIALVHGKWGFYMNWYSERRGEGFEFHLLVLAIMIVLIIRGGGKASIDRWIARRLGRTQI